MIRIPKILLINVNSIKNTV